MLSIVRSTVAALALSVVARADTFATTGPAMPTQDLVTVTRAITVPAGADFVITDLDVIVSVPHVDSSQLSIRLRHPDGTVVRLAAQVPGQGFLHAVFDDEASDPPPGIGVQTGSFLPHDPLSAFDAKHAAGTWMLQVQDFVAGGSGTVRSCALAFNGMTFVQSAPLAIPQYGTVESTLVVPVDVVVADAEATVDLDHSQMLDLQVHLIAPQGAQSKLFDSIGAATGMHGTTFDDQAADLIDNAPALATGRWRTTSLFPEPLALLDGAATAGTWKLSIYDEDPVEGLGELTAWSVHIVPAGPCADVASHADDYGAGTPGALGVPALVAATDPDLGGQFTVHVSNSAGVPQQAALFIGLSSAATAGKGGTLLVAPLLQVTLTLPVAGLDLGAALPANAGLCGTHLFLQSLHADAAAPQGVAFSAGLDLVFGS